MQCRATLLVVVGNDGLVRDHALVRIGFQINYTRRWFLFLLAGSFLTYRISELKQAGVSSWQ